METLLPGNTNNQSYSPQLKTVLKTYQLSAVKSLQGPSSALLGMDCKSLRQEQSPFGFPSLSRPVNTCGILDSCQLTEQQSVKEIIKKIDDSRRLSSPSPRVLVGECSPEDSDEDPLSEEKLKTSDKRELEFQIPILTASDQSCSERCETILENERISCFVVGGERRLCLPQILNTVLQDFSLQQINQVCDELQIYCSRCTHDQLEELKHSGILPRSAPSCGLITQTDAERLVSALLLRTETRDCPMIRDGERDIVAEEKARSKKEDGAESCGRFKVYHECFGKCKGIFDADMFDSEDSACIECLECGCQFSPQRFVRHAHRPLENRTCHWGFDSTNWRSYLLLSRDQSHYNKVVSLFRSLKARCPVASFKRKSELRHDSEKLAKRSKKEISRDECTGVYNGNGLGMYHPVSSAGGPNDPYLQWAVFELAARGASAFRPWNPAGSCKHRESSPLVPAYLSRGPPVLQHPERVVPMSECERFEPHFQPNVALAPIPSTASSIPTLPSASSSLPGHRRPLNSSTGSSSGNERHRRNNHCPSSPTPEKLMDDGMIPISVKLEKPSTPLPETIGNESYASSLHGCGTDGEHSNHGVDNRDRSNHGDHRTEEMKNCGDNRDDENDDTDDTATVTARVAPSALQEEEEEEEESSAAVTSSTITMETPPAEVATSSHESDSETENGAGAAAVAAECAELEERLLALDVPRDLVSLARKISLDNARLRQRHRADLREIARLRCQLELQKLQTRDCTETRDKRSTTNPSDADSTGGNDETNDKTLPTDNIRDNDPPLASVSSD